MKSASINICVNKTQYNLINTILKFRHSSSFNVKQIETSSSIRIIVLAIHSRIKARAFLFLCWEKYNE